MRVNGLKTPLFQRPRLLWLVLGAMLLVSALPLSLYHRQVLRLSQEMLTDTESVIPDNDMTFRLNDGAERAGIIAYLKQLSGKKQEDKCD